jgi:7tm Odorant receptor
MGVKEMDLDVSAVLIPGKFFLQKLGFWFENYTNIRKPKRLLRFVVIINTFLIMAMNISTILGVREKSLVESTFEILLFLRLISVFQKILIFKFKSHKIVDLFSDAFEKISVPDRVSELFDKYQNECKRKPKLVISIIVLFLITALTWVISIVALAYFRASEITASSLLGGTALPIWLPFDLNGYPLLKIFVLTYQLFVVQPIMGIMMGFFSFYSGTLILAQEMFKHLDEVLILLHKPINRDPPFNYELYVRQNQEVRDIIRYAVQHHNRSLKYY